MTPESILALLSRSAAAAAAKQARRQKRVQRFIARHAQLRDAYVSVRDSSSPFNPVGIRARALAESSEWRVLAWQALAEGDAEAARERRRHAAREKRAALAVVVP